MQPTTKGHCGDPANKLTHKKHSDQRLAHTALSTNAGNCSFTGSFIHPISPRLTVEAEVGDGVFDFR